MKLLRLIPILFITLGALPLVDSAIANEVNPNKYKVLTSKDKNFSSLNIQQYLEERDSAIKNGDFDFESLDETPEININENCLNSIFRIFIEIKNKKIFNILL